jgi:hypothetical protein
MTVDQRNCPTLHRRANKLPASKSLSAKEPLFSFAAAFIQS